MAWTAPRTYTAGEVITASILNAHLRDNPRYLKGLDGIPTIESGLIIDNTDGNEYLQIPSLTTGERDALTPVNGMVIYNETTGEIHSYESSAWVVTKGISTLVAYKASTETVNNSDTMQNDDDLNFAVGASDYWAFKLLLLYTTSPVSDIKFQFTVPASGTLRAFSSTDIGDSSSGAGGTAASWTQSAVALVEPHNTTTGIVTIEGVYYGGGTAGTVQLQWAQNTAEVSDTSVLQGSYLIAQKLNA